MAPISRTETSVARVAAIHYPESDGKPLGETGVHVDVIALDLLDVIRRFFDLNRNVAIQSNMFVYYLEGDNRRVVCPDLFVALGVPSRVERRTYKIWEEGKGPDLVIEVTSKKTRRQDQTTKFELYRDVLKVREYFLFDPFEEYLKPSLQGYRLVGGRYQAIAAVRKRLLSQVLGLQLERDHLDLRLYNPLTGAWLPTSMELERALEATEARSRDDQAARVVAEAARLDAEAARLDADAKSRQLEDEVQRLRRELEVLRTKRSK